jgi:hypothetical protein
MRNRATQRHQAPQVDPGTNVRDYFFETKQGEDDSMVLVPRKDLVRRDEMWGAFEWYHRTVTKQNRWYRKLWRALRGALLVDINPFRLARASGHEAANPLEAEQAPERRGFDANGRPQ